MFIPKHFIRRFIGIYISAIMFFALVVISFNVMQGLDITHPTVTVSVYVVCFFLSTIPFLYTLKQ